MSEDMPESFRDHLDRASAMVAAWPEWKRNLLGKPSRKENVKMSETEKAPWQAALDLLRLQRREAKIAAMEAKPKQYNSVQDMVDATSPELSQEFRDRKPNGERIRELTEDNADRLTEAEIRAAIAEIRAAIDAKQEDFLMRLQRWEKTKATVVGAVMEEEPCSYCNAEPSSFKVEMLPREITWREVEEAVRAAQEQHPEGVGVEFDEAFGYWHTRVCVGQEDTPHEAIEDALTHLRELAQPKPEPITPEKLWAECGGTGPIPKWAREAALAEAGRRNAKGGE